MLTSVLQGGLQFTTTEASREFARSVLNYLRPPDVVYLLAEALDSRLQELTEGRMWMGSHMRRGDCECLSECIISK